MNSIIFDAFSSITGPLAVLENGACKIGVSPVAGIAILTVDVYVALGIKMGQTYLQIER